MVRPFVELSCQWHCASFPCRLSDINKLTYGKRSLEDCVSASGADLFGCPPLNYQTSYFCGHEPGCSDPPDVEPLLAAVRHAVHDYAVIGTLEEIYTCMFLEQLIQVFPQWFAPSGGNALQRTYSFDAHAATNKNHRKHTMQEDDPLMAAVREANEYDHILYDLVKEIAVKRQAACAAEGKEPVVWGKKGTEKLQSHLLLKG